jgi:PAS domain S-box-containing protein
MREILKPARPIWTGYAFAVAAVGVAFLFRFEADRLIGDTISLPLCALAAVFACLWITGPAYSVRPALIATVLTTTWYILDFQSGNPPAVSATIHYALYICEAGLLCLFGRQLRTARDLAAKGEDWQRHLVETAGEGIWMIDPAGVVAYANPRIAEILGCAEDRIVGRKFETFLFPEDHSAERIRFQNRRPTAKEQYDRRLRHSDGSIVWTLACSSIWSYNGKDVGVLTMMTDITERKKAENALRRSERKFRELFENIREGVYQTSPDGRILAANPELLRMLSFTSPEELNVPGVVRDTFVDTDLHQSLRDRLERDGSYAAVEFQLRTRDRRIITVRENARVVRDENGHVLYYEGSLTDITERLRFERQLRQAQKMEALGRLAGGIARDFRTIGSGIAVRLRHVLDSLPPESPVRADLEAVAKGVENGAALTRQILEFSQRQTSERTAMDVNAVIAQLEPDLRRLIAHETTLQLSLCADSTPVLADPGHIRQIVTSFVIHAREFGGGAGIIEVVTAVDSDGPAAINTPSLEPAPGNSVRELLRSAVPFVSLCVRGVAGTPAPQTPHENESGLLPGNARPWIGMATSQAILAQYGGMMTAVIDAQTAESGKGVRYSLYLPLAHGAKTERSTAPSMPSVATVLLVEEEPLIRELSRDMLERQGFEVLTAGTIDEVKRLAAAGEHFDVLIIARSGEDVINLRPGVRVLFICGYSDEAPDSTPLPENAAILQKPFSGESLARKVRELLSKAQTATK